MSTTPAQPVAPAPGRLDRLLGLFSDVRAGEGGRALLMLVNVFLILVCYYILKTVREPLILATDVPEVLQGLGIHDTAEVKTYASAGQALLLMGFVPAYGWFASSVNRSKLVLGVTLFFVANIVAFALGVSANADHIGVYFYIWVGIFSLSIIAQFWSYANDTYSKEAGGRLFPIIAIGSTIGSPIGAWRGRAHVRGAPGGAQHAVSRRRPAAGHGGAVPADRQERQRERPAPAAGPGRGRPRGKNGFALVFASPYIRLIALLLVLLNVVNTTGEFILSHMVTVRAEALLAADPAFDKGAYIGALLRRLLLLGERRGAGAAGLRRLAAREAVRARRRAVRAAADRARLVRDRSRSAPRSSVVRWAKTAENSADYSVMNTAKQLLWLPTTPRGEVQGQAGGRRLLLPDRRPGRRRWSCSSAPAGSRWARAASRSRTCCSCSRGWRSRRASSARTVASRPARPAAADRDAAGLDVLASLVAPRRLSPTAAMQAPPAQAQGRMAL